jgi:ferredoxin-NADP reductase
MMAPLDYLLDRITMYRLTLYVLIAFVAVAAALSQAGLLPYSPGWVLISAAFLALACWATNAVLAWAFAVPTNVESAFITALILALIIDPAGSPNGLQLLGWAAVLAMASKYLLAAYSKHLFNPAAIAVVITAFALGEPASWWIGTGSMLPVVAIGGLLIVRKMRQEEMVGVFLAAALVTVVGISLLQHLALAGELRLLVIDSPLVFVAAIMLTEPLTAPPTRDLKRIYALLTGILIVPQIHVGPIYSTPELALVAGNLFAYLVSPKRRVVLQLKKKNKLAPDLMDFVFVPSAHLAFAPGQYIECTLQHPRPDGRGNRRYFTLASSPTEEAVHLGVRFYRQGSSFKRALATMSSRSTMVAGQIAGDFTLPADRGRKLAFIAGGIGITPYRSMLKYLVDTKQRRDIVLLYANRVAGEIVYREVLAEAQATLGVKLAYTLTDTAAVPKDWTGHKGRITGRMVQAAIPDYAERTFYISGPPEMVRATERVLRALGVRRRQIKRDFFPGLV